MKKSPFQIAMENNPRIKEISDGVYINLNRIRTEASEFEKAIEESFQEVEKREASDDLKDEKFNNPSKPPK